ncbi:MAG: hypothetical protein COC19_03880 [SAR86 cluster bacterium]|uniref:YgjP-like metallopeptidase domain-containing protein n=1 Tax=SAR86 cluster bacterium TaxID=2030880 RepID=A0A2A4MPU3_9GAMM|nr:MAG: hypothetical protein COC19_03880 [SAR86 cluster bacterium]
MSRSKILPLTVGRSKQYPSGHFDCEILRSKRKTLSIHIKHNRVEVRSPLRTKQADIELFVATNREWIVQRLDEENRHFEESLRIEKGRKIFYRARELDIVFQQGRKERVMLGKGQFIIQGHKLNVRKAEVQVSDFLIEKANGYLMHRTRALAEFLKVGHKLNNIRLKKTKTKWGHCTSTGVIQFNWLIMLAPYSIIDYMIAHEVCHLVHMDHSKKYWKLVASVCPEYAYYMDWLKRHEHRFWF